MSAAVSLLFLEKRAKSLGDDLEWELSNWASDYFNAIDVPGSPNVWRHVPITNMLNTDSFVAGNYIKPLAAQYIEFPPNLQDKNADWLVADTLCFAEVNATLVYMRKMKGGKQAVPTGLRVGIAAWSVLMWIIWVAILGFGFAVQPWLGWGLVAVTALVQLAKWRASTARNKLLTEMLGTYQALESTTFSWAVLWDHMSRSRALGAVWPPELYRLVELRMQR